MSFASRHNNTTFTYDFDTKGFNYLKASALDDNTIYKLYGYFFTTGSYGKQAILVTDKFYLNVPNYLVNDIEKFSDEDVTDIKHGKVGFKKSSYDKNGKTHYTIEWIDLN